MQYKSKTETYTSGGSAHDDRLAATNQVATATTNLDSRWQCPAGSPIIFSLISWKCEFLCWIHIEISLSLIPIYSINGKIKISCFADKETQNTIFSWWTVLSWLEIFFLSSNLLTEIDSKFNGGSIYGLLLSGNYENAFFWTIFSVALGPTKAQRFNGCSLIVKVWKRDVLCGAATNLGVQPLERRVIRRATVKVPT